MATKIITQNPSNIIKESILENIDNDQLLKLLADENIKNALIPYNGAFKECYYKITKKQQPETSFVNYLEDKKDCLDPNSDIRLNIPEPKDFYLFCDLHNIFKNLDANGIIDSLRSLIEALDSKPDINLSQPRIQFISMVDPVQFTNFSSEIEEAIPSLVSGRVNVDKVLNILRSVNKQFESLQNSLAIDEAFAPFKRVFESIETSKLAFPYIDRPCIDYVQAAEDISTCVMWLDKLTPSTQEIAVTLNSIKATLNTLTSDYDIGISRLDGTVNKEHFKTLINRIKAFIGKGNKEAINIIDRLSGKIETNGHLQNNMIKRIGGFDPTSFRTDLNDAAKDLLKLENNKKINLSSPSKVRQIANALRALSDYHAWYITENHRSFNSFNKSENWGFLKDKTPGTAHSSSGQLQLGLNVRIGGKTPTGQADTGVKVGAEYTYIRNALSGTEIDGSDFLVQSTTHRGSLKAGASAVFKIAEVKDAQGKKTDVRSGISGSAFISREKVTTNYSEFYGDNADYARDIKSRKPDETGIYGSMTKKIVDHRREFHSRLPDKMDSSNSAWNALKNIYQGYEKYSSSVYGVKTGGRNEESTKFTAAGSRLERTHQCIIADDNSDSKDLIDFLKSITSIKPVFSDDHIKTMGLQGTINTKTWRLHASGLAKFHPAASISLSGEGRTSRRDLSFWLLRAPHVQIEKHNKDPESTLAWGLWRNMLNVAPQLYAYCEKYQKPKIKRFDTFKEELGDLNSVFISKLGDLEKDFEVYSHEVERLSAATAAMMSKTPLDSDLITFRESMKKLSDTFALDFSLPSEEMIKHTIPTDHGKKDLLELAYGVIGESFAAISLAAAAVKLQVPISIEGNDNISAHQTLNAILDSIDRGDFTSIDADVIHGHSPLLMAKDIVTTSKSVSVQLAGIAETPLNLVTFSEKSQKTDFAGNPVFTKDINTGDLVVDFANSGLPGPLAQFGMRGTYTYEDYDRTHINPIREGNYGKHQIDLSLSLSGFGIETLDVLVKLVGRHACKNIMNNTGISEEDRKSMVEQMSNPSFVKALKSLFTELFLKGNGIPRNLEVSWIRETHSLGPTKNKTAYTQLSASVSKGHGLSLDTDSFGITYPIGGDAGYNIRDTLTVASPLMFGSDVLVHALRYSSDIAPCIEEDKDTGRQGIKQIHESTLTNDEKTQWQAQLQKLQVNLFSDSSSLINLIEEAFKADVESPSENSFSWLFQEKKTMKNGTTKGLIDKELRDTWFNSLSPFSSPGTKKLLFDKTKKKEEIATLEGAIEALEFRLAQLIKEKEELQLKNDNIAEQPRPNETISKERNVSDVDKLITEVTVDLVGSRDNLHKLHASINDDTELEVLQKTDRKYFSELLNAAKIFAKGKSPEELLAYFRDNEDGKKLMDSYIQVIQFANHCADVVSFDSSTEPSWKHVAEAAKTITPSTESPLTKGVTKRAEEKLKNLSSEELEAIKLKVKIIVEEINKDPTNYKGTLRTLVANNRSPQDQLLVEILNPKSKPLANILSALHAIETIARKIYILRQSIQDSKKPDEPMNPSRWGRIQPMVARLNELATKEKWDKQTLENIGAAAARLLAAFDQLKKNDPQFFENAQNLKRFISGLNASKIPEEKWVSKIMNSGSGGLFRSPERPDKFREKLEALCGALELKITTPMTGNKYRPGGLEPKDQGNPL